jgi:mono/diheme cytochrome c family protein
MWAMVPPATQAVLVRGKLMFNFSCAPCHGKEGKGDGPLAANLNNTPDDLTTGFFHNRSTAFGQLPTDYDIYRTITSGIHNTAMPLFQQMLPEDRGAVVQYIKTLSPFFSDSTQYPLTIVRIGEPIQSNLHSLKEGRRIYLETGCANCHGMRGRGDGPNKTQPMAGLLAGMHIDEADTNIKPTDLTNPSEYAFARSVADVCRILATGLNVAAMPSFAKRLSEEERWNLANYVWALQNADQYQDEKE